MIKFKSHYAKGLLDSYANFRYDDENKLKEWDLFNGDGSYPPNGRLIYGFKVKFSNDQMEVEETVHPYLNNESEYKNFHRFDIYGKLVESYRLDYAGNKEEIRTFFYENFDLHNNWTKMTTFNKNDPSYITIREITYRQ